MRQSKILVFSIALGGYSQLFESCLISQKKYCSKYNFNHTVIRKEPVPMQPYEAGWLKLHLLREALKCDYSWVGFIDADCEIREHTPDFSNYLDKLDSKASTYIAHGFSGRINSGVIFMKNTAEAQDYLDEVINNKNNPVPEEDKAIFENGHMIKYGKNNPSVKIIDNRLWNNNIVLNPESYIQHYSGGILRPIYLKQHPLANKIYRIKKKWKIHLKKYKDNSEITPLETIVPWFKKEYPEFNEVLK